MLNQICTLRFSRNYRKFNRCLCAGMSVWTHLAALTVACTVGIMAFSLPAKPIPISSIIEPLPISAELEVVLPLPEADEATLYGAENIRLANDWTTATVQPGDNLSGIFNRLGLKADDLYSLISCCNEAKSLSVIKPGEVFKIRTDNGGDLVELVFASEPENAVRIFRDGNQFKAGEFRHIIEKRPAFVAAKVRDSFAQDALQAGLSKRLLKQLQSIVGKQIDLETDIVSGDSFTVLYEEDFFSGEKVGDGDILAIDFFTADVHHRIVGFRNNNGELRYYTPAGKSLRPAFLRYPVSYQKITSNFSRARLHPVLGVRRPHYGVDLAAPRGTPIRAVGDGVIDKMGWQSGYGKTIMIDHGRGHTTLYGHMSGFNTELREGAEVSKGQIIGYVGSTGLATGSHLHYEFRFNNEPQDPLKVALPGDPPLKGRQGERFQQQIQPLLAQLDLHRRVRLALSDVPSTP